MSPTDQHWSGSESMLYVVLHYDGYQLNKNRIELLIVPIDPLDPHQVIASNVRASYGCKQYNK